MRQTEIKAIRDVKELTGFDEINTALSRASQFARQVDFAPRLVIDPKNPVESMRNFTKVLDELHVRDIRMFVLLEYVDDEQRG